MKVKIIIAGSRDFANYKFLELHTLRIIKQLKLVEYNTTRENIEIISGTAKGADQLGEKFAEKFNLNTKRFPADWEKFGKSAGYKRNEQMAIYAAKDSDIGILIAFWDGISKGTGHMIDLARKYDLKVFVIN